MANINDQDYSLRKMNPQRIAAIREYAGRSILDVGCGNGAYVTSLAKDYEIAGVDYREFPSWSSNPERFTISDAHSLKALDESVETILSFETLEHLEDPKRALMEYFRVCRKNIIITVPNCELTEGLKSSGLIYNHWIDRSHINFWTLEELQKLVSSVGFSIRVGTYINPVRLGPILMEAVGITGKLARLGSVVVQSLSKRKHHMTLLIIAEKIRGGD